jgi:hypothetical protein
MSELLEIKLVETGTSSASIPITWCIDKEWLKKNGTNSFIFLVTTPLDKYFDNKAEWVGYCRISELASYVRFYRPGKNRIFAILDKTSPLDKDRIKGLLNNNYLIDHPESKLEFDGFNPIEDCKINPCCFDLVESHIDIELPEEVFAKQPSSLESRWVNFFYERAPIDQCQYRRRKIFAYTLAPFLVVLYYSINILLRYLIYVGLLLAGYSRLNWRILFNYSLPICSIWEGSNGSWFEKNGVFPGIMIGPITCFFGIMSLIFAEPNGWLVYLMVLSITIPSLILCLLIVVIKKILNKKEPIIIDDECIEAISCGGNGIKKIGEVKSIKLRYEEIKGQVCKPYRK